MRIRSWSRASVVFLFLGLSIGAYSLTTWVHLAGSRGGPGCEDGVGSDARFNNPAAVATDTAGNVYVADTQNHTIRKITTSGEVFALAGRAGQAGSFDGRGAAARFKGPEAIAVDSSGTVYVADTGNNTIRKISPEGVVTTLAGTAGTRGDADGTGADASFDWPRGITVDSAGVVYVADTFNSTIRKITTAGAVSTFAGTASNWGSADGTGSAASFDWPRGLALDSSGILYVADGSSIRKITTGGVVTTLAAITGDPSGVCVNAAGTVFVSDTLGSAIFSVTPGGIVSTYSGGGSGSTDRSTGSARFARPSGITLDSTGNLYVADTENSTIRKISGGNVSTIAGLAAAPGFVDSTTPDAVRFNNITSVASYPGYSSTTWPFFAVDSGNNAVRQIDPTTGAVSTLAGGTYGYQNGTGTAARFANPHGIALAAASTPAQSSLYVADTDNHVIRKISASGDVTLFAGTPGTAGSANGDRLTQATFRSPEAVAVDSSAVYVADTGNYLVRRIDLSTGMVSTVAGDGTSGLVNANGVAARFGPLSSITKDAATGNLYVTERQQGVVRRIAPNGDVTTVAGSSSYSTIPSDGAGTAARFGYPGPTGIATSGSYTFIADAVAQAIRLMDSSFAVTTLGGTLGLSGTTDGTDAFARFNSPRAISVAYPGPVVAEPYRLRVGTQDLGDRAWIDSASGPVGVMRQLGAGSAYGTSFQWRIIRRPVGSTATLSSTTIANPTFTPDVDDLYVFRLTATANWGRAVMSVSEVSLQGVSASCTAIDTTVTAPSSMCSGASATASVPDAGAGATYQWSVAGGTITSGAGTRTITFVEQGSWWASSLTVGVQITSGQCTVGSSKIIPVQQSADASFYVNPTPSCPGSVQTVRNYGVGNATYNWSIVGGRILSGQGTDTITYAVDVSGAALTLETTGIAPCSSASKYTEKLPVTATSVYADYYTFAAGGGSGTLTVSAPSGCQWTATSLADWLTFAAPASGTGNGVMSFSVAPATLSRPRDAAVIVAGQPLSFMQLGAAASDGKSLLVSHLTGNRSGAGYQDGAGSTARFSYPLGLAIDGGNNLYVADSRNSVIRKITPDGTVSTFAGLAGFNGTAVGVGSAARFVFPDVIATDSAGNVYVADRVASRLDNVFAEVIRKFTPNGSSVVAGRPDCATAADGPAGTACFGYITSMTVDPAGTIYVTENNTVRSVAPDGSITTIAGQAGQWGTTDGNGSAARFEELGAIARDSTGNLFVADYYASTIRRIDASGNVTTFAGSPEAWGTTDGTGTQALFAGPTALAFAPDGSLVVGDTDGGTVRKITPAAVVTTIAALSSASSFGTYMAGIAVASTGDSYVLDANDNTVLRVTPAGAVSTIAGLAPAIGAAEGPLSDATLRYPRAVVADSLGNLFIADTSNSVIRKISAAGVVSTFAGTAAMRGSANGNGTAARFNTPYGIAIDSANVLYVADTNNNVIRKVLPNGDVTTLAGTAGSRGSTDGNGSTARFFSPRGIAVGANGVLYVSDSGNYTVRAISPSADVTTLAGQAGVYGSSDGNGAAAQFSAPAAIAVAGDGNVYVGDGRLLRMVTPAGVVSTVGSPLLPQSDGSGNNRGLVSITGLAADHDGSLWIVDGRQLRKLTSTGDLMTLAGAGAVGNTDGTGGNASFFFPQGLTVDASNRLIIADTSNSAIRMAVPNAAAGDINGDARITAADVFYLINYLFTNGSAPVGSGDANGDGLVNVKDLFYLINYLYAGGPAPASSSSPMASLSQSRGTIAIASTRTTAGQRRVVVPIVATAESLNELSLRIVAEPRGAVESISVTMRPSRRPFFEQSPAAERSAGYVALFDPAAWTAAPSGSVVAGEITVDLTDGAAAAGVIRLHLDGAACAIGRSGDGPAEGDQAALDLTDGAIEVGEHGREIESQRLAAAEAAARATQAENRKQQMLERRRQQLAVEPPSMSPDEF